MLEVNSIVATVGHTGNPGNTRHDYVPPLNNQTLFRRDGHLCMYCGQRFPSSQLSRDHVTPLEWPSSLETDGANSRTHFFAATQ